MTTEQPAKPASYTDFRTGKRIPDVYHRDKWESIATQLSLNFPGWSFAFSMASPGTTLTFSGASAKAKQQVRYRFELPDLMVLAQKSITVDKPAGQMFSTYLTNALLKSGAKAVV